MKTITTMILLASLSSIALAQVESDRAHQALRESLLLKDNPVSENSKDTINGDSLDFQGKNCKAQVVSEKEFIDGKQGKMELYLQVEAEDGNVLRYISHPAPISSAAQIDKSKIKVQDVISAKDEKDYHKRGLISRKQMLEIQNKKSTGMALAQAFKEVTGNEFSNQISQSFEAEFSTFAISRKQKINIVSKLLVELNGKKLSCDKMTPEDYND